MASTIQIRILGLGNPLLDISAVVPESFLKEYDLTLNNAILAEEKHAPIYQRLIDEFKASFIPGGATQNSMRVAQWLLEPGSTGFMGSIGSDSYGKILKECAEKAGVKVHYMIDANNPTGTCGVLIHKNERSLVTNLAAANSFKISHLGTSEAIEMIDSANIYYMSGFFITVSVDSMIHVAKEATKNHKLLAINLSAPFLVDFFTEQLESVLYYTDYLFGNESEAEAFGKKFALGNDVGEIALAIASRPKSSGKLPRIVVFTQGSESTIVACEGKLMKFPVPVLEKSLLIDTNGAGDAFVGGFLAGLAKGKSVEKCVEVGHWAARQIIQTSGCVFPKECEFNL